MWQASKVTTGLNSPFFITVACGLSTLDVRVNVRLTVTLFNTNLLCFVMEVVLEKY